jgi:protein PsiE
LNKIDIAGSNLVKIFHRIGLFAIGAATVWASVGTFFDIIERNWPGGHATVQDLLLLFIYLEIGAMVGIYFTTNHMPVRFLVYIAITALTRHVIDLIANHRDVWEIIAMGLTTLLFAASVLLLRFGSYKFPSDRSDTK